MSGLQRTITPGVPLGLAPRWRKACETPPVVEHKHANENLDYTIDFSYKAEACGDGAGASDSLTNFSVVSLPGGLPALTPSQKSTDGFLAKFWLAGGVPGMRYLITVAAVTATGRAMQGTFELVILNDCSPNNPAWVSPVPVDVIGSNGEQITDASGNPITTA
jgi:hypothetical protein